MPERLKQAEIDQAYGDVVHNSTLDDMLFYSQFVSDPTVQSVFGRTALRSAIGAEDAYARTEMVLKLYQKMLTRMDENGALEEDIIRARDKINERDRDGRTLAMNVFEAKHAGLGILLMKNGIDVLAKDNAGNGTFKYVVNTMSPDAIQKAVELGCDLLETDADGHDAIYWATENKDIESLRALYKLRTNAGIQMDLKSPSYLAALALAQEFKNPKLQDAVRGNFEAAEKETKITKTRQMLSKKIRRLTPADRKRLEKWFKEVISYHEDKQLSNPSHKIPNIEGVLSEILLRECKAGSAEDVRLVLDVGANPNAYDAYGKSALMTAIESFDGRDKTQSVAENTRMKNNSYRKTHLLLAYGANPNQPNYNLLITDKLTPRDPLETPMIGALVKDKVGIYRLLHRYGGELTPGSLELAIRYSKPEAVDAVLEFGGNLHEKDAKGHGALYWATEVDKPQIIARLYDRGLRVSPVSAEGLETLALSAKKSNSTQMALRGEYLSEKPAKKTFDEKVDALNRDGIGRLIMLARIRRDVAHPTMMRSVKKTLAAQEDTPTKKTGLLFRFLAHHGR